MGNTEPYRILQVGMSPYYGGTEAFIMSQYRRIDRTRIQFDFLNVFQTPIACEEEIKNLGGHIYYLDMSRRKGVVKYHRRLDCFFKEHSSKFDAIHCNFQSLVNIDLLKYAKKYGIIGRIAHAHNAGYGTEPNILQKALISNNKRIISMYATHFFACSALAGEWMFGENNGKVIHNSIDSNVFLFDEEVREKIRTEYGLQNRKLIVFVGRLDPQKNPLFVVDVFNEIHKAQKDWMLFVIGDGVLRADIESRISQYGLQSEVRLLGSRRDVNVFLQAADIFLFPSKFEGLGIALIEAQAAGLKCFTSEGVVPEEVNISGLVEFISLEEGASLWAEKILATDIYERQNMYETIVGAGYDSTTSIAMVEKEYFTIVGKCGKV